MGVGGSENRDDAIDKYREYIDGNQVGQYNPFPGKWLYKRRKNDSSCQRCNDNTQQGKQAGLEDFCE